jgi:hypothetical protein
MDGERHSEKRLTKVLFRVVDSDGVIFQQAIATGNESDAVLQSLAGLGCDFERATGKDVAVNIPPRADLRAVVNYLIERELKWEHADPTYEEFHAAQ